MNTRALTIGVLALLAGTNAVGQASFRGDSAHSGVYASQGPRQFHRVRWAFPTGSRIVSSPVYADGTIFFGSDDGNLYAVEAATGRQLWRHATGGPVSGSPAVADGAVYFTSYDGKFYSLSARSGITRWKFTTSGERRFEARGIHGLLPRNQTIPDQFDIYLSSPVIADGAVFFGSGDGNVYSLDAVTGALRWKYQTGEVVHASPAFAKGVVYVGSWDSYFYALDARTGQLRWKFHGGEDPDFHNQVGFQSSPAVVNGTVYTGCRDAHLYALDAETGAERWNVDTKLSWVITSPAVVKGKVIFGTSDSSLYQVVDAETGKALQQLPTQAYVFSSPAVAGDTVLVGVLNGTLQSRDLNTGALLWSFETDAAKRNENWVLSADRKFNSAFLFRSRWRESPVIATERQFSVGSFFSSPLIVDGLVYIGSADGNLYAIE